MLPTSYPITAWTLTSALGTGVDAHINALTNHQTGLSPHTHEFNPRLASFYGEVQGVANVSLPHELADYHCRNHQLAYKAMQADGFEASVAQARTKYGAHRVGVLMGTSTSGILETEQALAFKDAQDCFPEDYHYATTHEMDALAQFCSKALQVTGPSMVISTACSSSAKVFASAVRWLENDLVDAVVVGGVDSFCLTTIHGFNALGLISQGITRPYSADRNGINIGEAGGFALIEKPSPDSKAFRISGVGESSDAYHISSPSPDGEGAALAMKKALKMAHLKPGDIDYLNLHGTGTPSNDVSESKAVKTVFGHSLKDLPKLSSTKGFTGHTLGAAGITEAVICLLALKHQCVFANLNLSEADESLGLGVIERTHDHTVTHCMSNSFGFGGNNACLIFSCPENIS